ncbi:MAG TPA: hypothetical protein VGZ00_04585 [Candidatus Baltobacteraceae bacterium]|nr:hypothetical protein [Candidatus Baltobacteraceae bacterium]
MDEFATLYAAYRSHDRLLVQGLLAPEVEPESDEIAALAEVTEEDAREAHLLGKVFTELGLH